MIWIWIGSSIILAVGLVICLCLLKRKAKKDQYELQMYKENLQHSKNELSRIEQLIASRLQEYDHVNENYRTSSEALNALESRIDETKDKYDQILGSYQDQVQSYLHTIQSYNTSIDQLKVNFDIENDQIEAKKQEVINLTQDVNNLTNLLNWLKLTHANAVKVGAQEENNELGWTFECSPNELRLIEVLDGLKLDYPDLAVELGGIEWRKVWLGKVQSLVKLEGLDGLSGIYRLIRKDNPNAVYIGQATDIKSRWYTHIKKMIGAENKGNEKVYDGLPSDYWWYVVEEVKDKSKLDEREKWWIDYYASDSVGLNKKSGNR